MEKLLHYAWKHKILPLQELKTTNGQDIEIIDPGMANMNAGPDFFNAKVKIDGVTWAGNVELHLRSSDWFRHGHQDDDRYNNVILHVATVVDADVCTHDGKQPPQLQMPLPEKLTENYHQLLETMDYPRCHKLIPTFDILKVHAWMDALLNERLHERASLVQQRLSLTNNDWERAFMITLARNFGFSLNGDAFERWGRIMPFYATAKHRNSLKQVEAIFLGVAGLLGKVDDEGLAREYDYLKHKFDITEELQPSDWRYLRTRPQNFPHTRLRQLARLYQSERATISRILEAESLPALHDCFRTEGLSASSMNLLVINTVVPVLCAYAETHGEEAYMDRARDLLEELKSESNYIMRQWQNCGLKVDTAADSQALIQLKRQYCDRKDCLRCRFGYEYLKTAKSI